MTTAPVRLPPASDVRCASCGALLAQATLGPGSELRIKCRCKAMNVLQVR